MECRKCHKEITSEESEYHDYWQILCKQCHKDMFLTTKEKKLQKIKSFGLIYGSPITEKSINKLTELNDGRN